MTPRILDSIVLTSCGLEGRFDIMRTALVVMIVAIGFSPAAFIVSPDSGPSLVILFCRRNRVRVNSLSLRKLTDKIHNTICNAQSASSLDAPTNILDSGLYPFDLPSPTHRSSDRAKSI